MATVDFNRNEIDERGDHGHILTWEITSVDTAIPVEMIGSARRTVQVVGSFSGADTVVIEGSNDGTNYQTLFDVHGNTLEFKGEGLSTIGDLTAYTRPRISAGTPTGVRVIMLVRKEAR